MRWDRAELAGALADLGVLVPIAVALIVRNGLSPTAVLVPTGVLYVACGLIYRLPIPVQPLKAFGAIAIAQGLSVAEISAGALLLGAVFVILSVTGLIDAAAALTPLPVIRGVQLSVGLVFVRLAWDLASSPPESFADHTRPTWWLLAGTALAAALALALRRHGITVVLVGAAALVMVGSVRGQPGADGLWGPSALALPALSGSAFAAAAVALVLPQLPLTFANSCVATADVARRHFGDGARRVSPGGLALSLGVANLAVGAVGGMPLCHGAGGLTAHRAFGARTGAAPIAVGALLVTLGLVVGAGLTSALTAFPVPILAALLVVAGVLHLGLLRDLVGFWPWALAVAVGLAGYAGNLAVALLAGAGVWHAAQFRARRAARGR